MAQRSLRSFLPPESLPYNCCLSDTPSSTLSGYNARLSEMSTESEDTTVCTAETGVEDSEDSPSSESSGYSAGVSDTSTDFEDTTSTVCAAECCSLTRGKPYQPISQDILANTKRIQGHGRNQQARYVQPKWFKEHSWLTLCITRQRVFYF